MGFECLGPSDYSACSQQGSVLEIDSLLLCILLILVLYCQHLFAMDSPNALNELGNHLKKTFQWSLIDIHVFEEHLCFIPTEAQDKFLDL